MATEESNINCYLTEELVIQILLRLPIASCLARFRCVCKSWCSLLSDPKFIRDIIFFRNCSNHHLVIKRLCHDRSVYSLHSYDTLRLLHASSEMEEEDLPSLPYKVRWPNGTCSLSIVGCCNGIFCLADGNSDGASDIILWNPETWETKVLPVSPFAHLRGFVVWAQLERIGFGFDPVTNDFKVVRTLQFSPGDDDGNYSEELEENNNNNDDDEEAVTSEVYSLRNDSWRKLEAGFTHALLYSIPQSGDDGRFYWWDDGREGYTDFVSFDMSSEAFSTMEVANPVQMSSKFSIRSVSIVKGAAVAIFSDMETVEVANSMEIWMVLKLGGAWTKLWSIGSSVVMKCVHPVGIWRNGQCFLQRYDDGELIVVDPESGDIRELKIEGEWQFFQVVPYAPSQLGLASSA
ncbi:F-box/kelch-repeat protein At3g06240 [Linum perenne]